RSEEKSGSGVTVLARAPRSGYQEQRVSIGARSLRTASSPPDWQRAHQQDGYPRPLPPLCNVFRMTARMVEHIIASDRRKRREIYASVLVVRALTRNDAARWRAGSANRLISDARLNAAGSRTVANLRAV